MESKRTCPECHLIFEAELPATGILVCPLCNSAFAALPPAGPAPSAAPATASARQMLRGVAAVGAVLLFAAGMGYAYHLLRGIDHKHAPLATSTAHDPPAPPSPPLVEYVPVIPIEPRPPQVVIEPRPPVTIRRQPRPPKRLSPAIVEEQRRFLTLPERINDAIARGLAYLRERHNEHPQYRRYVGLLGLTLLECGLAADDPSVQQIAVWLRAQERQITSTYELTLAILFLDRLGAQRDRALISNFGKQLLWGQLGCGSWSYSCLLNDRQRSGINIWNGNHPAPQRRRVNFWNEQIPAWQRGRVNFWNGYNPTPQPVVYRGDNSNTQFAILGLWVAQRYGLSVHSALLANEQYFRNTQKDNGSWGYHANNAKWPDSMTCAGLMSLAMRHGISAGQGRDIRPDRRVSVYDPAVLRGLRYLAQSLDRITVVGNRIVGVDARNVLYFLWSLERMAVIYDLKKIGEREWYPWAAQLLVDTQGPDGRWTEMSDPVGTCFALLILKRSNFAKDLQLAVQERPSPSMPAISGPTILQGMDAILEQTRKPQHPAPAPLGPSIIQTPKTK